MKPKITRDNPQSPLTVACPACGQAIPITKAVEQLVVQRTSDFQASAVQSAARLEQSQGHRRLYQLEALHMMKRIKANHGRTMEVPAARNMNPTGRSSKRGTRIDRFGTEGADS